MDSKGVLSKLPSWAISLLCIVLIYILFTAFIYPKTPINLGKKFGTVGGQIVPSNNISEKKLTDTEITDRFVNNENEIKAIQSLLEEIKANQVETSVTPLTPLESEDIGSITFFSNSHRTGFSKDFVIKDENIGKWIPVGPTMNDQASSFIVSMPQGYSLRLATDNPHSGQGVGKELLQGSQGKRVAYDDLNEIEMNDQISAFMVDQN
ncbi:hypothetical protein NBRC116583_34460 [Arenicella sp. 4NH20-0111]|uniref:hypothetical protein n=1 Tax=Arenicella sp. 4NH20-0111 TaxID=3127648 RepID=UPI003101DB74